MDHRIVKSCVLIVTYMHACACAQDNSTAASTRAAVALEYIQINNASITKADVLIRQTESIDYKDGVRETTSFSRLMFDLEKEQLVHFMVETRMVATSENNRSLDAMMTCLVIKNNARRNRWPRPNVIESYRHDSFTQACLVSSGGVPFGMVGIQSYSHPSIPQGAQAKLSYQDYCDEKWDLYKSQAVSHGNSVSIGPMPVGTTNTSGIIELVLDAETGFPSIRTNYFVVDDKKGVNSKETMKWHLDESGHTLADSLFTDEFIPVQTEQGVRPGTKATNIEFHWFSVNKPLDEKYFAENCVSDGVLARKLTDPELTGATELKQQ